MIVVRYADDIVLGFQWGTDADRFRQSLGEHLRTVTIVSPEGTNELLW